MDVPKLINLIQNTGERLRQTKLQIMSELPPAIIDKKSYFGI